METKDLKFILEELQFSALLPAEMLEPLAAVSSLLTVSSGEWVFREGATSDKLYMVHQGRLALDINVPQRGGVRILTIGPGEMAGWSALLGDRKMTTSAIAVTDTQLVLASATELQGLCESNPEFGYRLMQRMAEELSKRLVATRLQLLDLFADTSPAVSPKGDA